MLCNTWIKRCIFSLIYQHKLQLHKTLLYQCNWLYWHSRTTKNQVNGTVKLTGKNVETKHKTSHRRCLLNPLFFPHQVVADFFFFQMSSAHFLSFSLSTDIKTSHYCEVERHWVPNFATLCSRINLNTSSKPPQSTELP